MEWLSKLFTGMVIAVVTSPIWGCLVWHIFQLHIKPRLVPWSDTSRMADALLAKYGVRAEEFAGIEEDCAWRYSRSFEQGKWHRVRRELEHRRMSGKHNGS